MSNTSVKGLHRENEKFLDKWRKVRHAIAGELKNYLRDVGATEPNREYGDIRQQEYEEGAICYNFTKRTLGGMVGSVFRKNPEVILPEKMQYLLQNADGSGVGLFQHAQDTLTEIAAVGRGGLLADAPAVSGATQADQNSGLLNPVIAFYTAENVVNWRLQRVGSVNRVVMVILREEYEYVDPSNEFVTHCGDQYRVLDIDESGKYRQRLYKFDTDGNAGQEVEYIYPKLNGVDQGVIPFTFVGATNNDSTVDDPPLLPLAELNIGHFRNSADNEESSFIVGQPTLFISPGDQMTVDQFKKANPDGVRMGSRIGHNIGSGGKAELVQADANNLAKENMLAKETQAIQIGAQLITPTRQITAEAARIQRGADTSVLASIAHNVSRAYTDALKWVAAMMGAGTAEVEFTLNTEFFLQPMTAQDRTAWMADINAGLLPATAYYAALRKASITDWTDDQIKEGLENQPLPVRGESTNVDGDIPSEANRDDDSDNTPQDNDE